MRFTSILLTTALLGAVSGNVVAQRSDRSLGAPRISTMQRQAVSHNALDRPLVQNIAQRNGVKYYTRLRTEANDFSTAIWRPQHETLYSYENGTWEPYASYDYTYDNVGVMTGYTLTMPKFRERHTKEYYPNGLLKSELWEYAYREGEEYGSFSPLYLETYKYDNVIYGETIEYLNNALVEGEWVPTKDSYRRTITRNEDGNVTQIDYRADSNGKGILPYERYDITYKDGEADTWKLYSYDGDNQYSLIYHLKDIIWEETDGQLVGNMNSFMVGNNRFTSATMDNRHRGDVDWYYTCTYENDHDYHLFLDIPAVGKNEHEVQYTDFVTIDENGSYQGDEIYYVDYDFNGEFDEEELADHFRVVDIYDEFGNERQYEEWEVDPATFIFFMATGESYDIDYHPEYNFKRETTMSGYTPELSHGSYGDPTGKGYWTPIQKIRAEVIDVTTGTSGIERAKTDVNPSAYYDLSGRRVTNPNSRNDNSISCGIYITSQGKKVMMR